jgi:hypothetical protein
MGLKGYRLWVMGQLDSTCSAPPSDGAPAAENRCDVAEPERATQGFDGGSETLRLGVAVQVDPFESKLSNRVFTSLHRLKGQLDSTRCSAAGCI